MDLEIVHVGRYTRPEIFSQRALFVHLGLCLGGLEYIEHHPPGGGEPRRLEHDAVPYLSLCPPGTRTNFRFTRARENWVIQCRIPGLEAVAGECRTRLRHGGQWLSAPYSLALQPERAVALRDRFDRVRHLWQSGIPANVAAAGWMAAGLAGEMVAENPGTAAAPPSAAARLRANIDADVGFRHTLAELSRATGASAGYLRRRFLAEFRIDPGEYRARRRLARILELLDRGDLCLKEVAARSGMKHVTHLYQFVRRRCGVTPGELSRQRGGLGSR